MVLLRPTWFFWVLVITIVLSYKYLFKSALSHRNKPDDNEPLIIVITPTYRRPERLAEITRFSQTLKHVDNLHWLVIEDGNATVRAVKKILVRSEVSHTYISMMKEEGMPPRGWTQRNRALSYIRSIYPESKNAVIYFGDDDNCYDVRLFNNYIRKVKKIGVWPVGLVGEAYVEAPHVENGTVVSWDVMFRPNRTFAVDMAGFAIHFREIKHTSASFKQCVIFSRLKIGPESCFLEQFGFKRDELEPFGYDEEPKDILVWHTKTVRINATGDTYGYVVENGEIEKVVIPTDPDEKLFNI